MVHLTTWATHSVHSVAFIIQSNAFTAAHMSARVEAFLEAFAARLGTLKQQEFAEQVGFAGQFEFAGQFGSAPRLPISCRPMLHLVLGFRVQAFWTPEPHPNPDGTTTLVALAREHLDPKPQILNPITNA
jgi:hypothetical protein